MVNVVVKAIISLSGQLALYLSHLKYSRSLNDDHLDGFSSALRDNGNIEELCRAYVKANDRSAPTADRRSGFDLAPGAGVKGASVRTVPDRALSSRTTDFSTGHHATDRPFAPQRVGQTTCCLSTKGERLINQFCQRRCDILNGALAHLSDAEKARVAEALGKVVEALEGYEVKLTNERMGERRFLSGKLWALTRQTNA